MKLSFWAGGGGSKVHKVVTLRKGPLKGVVKTPSLDIKEDMRQHLGWWIQIEGVAESPTEWGVDGWGRACTSLFQRAPETIVIQSNSLLSVNSEIPSPRSKLPAENDY